MKKFMMLFTFLSLLIASAVMAAVPSQMNVQGRLLNAGSPMTGSHPAIFSIYDAASAGSALWTESSSLDVQGGIFTATLGNVTPIPTIVFGTSPRWLEVTVDGNVLNPRLPLTTTGYAFRSQHADTANFALNAASVGDNLWSTDGINVWRTDGRVSIGTSSLESPLLVQKSISSGSANLLVLRNSGPEGGAMAFANGATGTYPPAGMYGIGDETDIRLAINRNNGNVGIGTTTPSSKLHVIGDIYADNGSDGSLVVNPAQLRFRHYTDMPNYTASIEYHYNYNNALGIYLWGDNRQIFGASADGGNIFFPTGNVSIAGNLTVAGTKCRVVNTDFGQVKLNATESGHALFMDDEPSARLVNGRCRVDLSPKFMATVTVNGKYPLAVNVTIYGQHGEWYIERDATGFTVIDPAGGNDEFSWQAIARQKNYENTYLDPVETTTAKQ